MTQLQEKRKTRRKQKEYCSEIEELSDWIKEAIKEYSKESEIFNVNIEGKIK